MSEGGSVETGQNPTPEKNPYSEASFRAVQAKTKELVAETRKGTSEDEKTRINKELGFLAKRKLELVSAYDLAGGLDGIRKTVGSFEQMLEIKQLSPKDILDERRYARNISGQEDEEFKGLGEWYYGQALDALQKKLDIQIQEEKRLREEKEEKAEEKKREEDLARERTEADRKQEEERRHQELLAETKKTRESQERTEVEAREAKEMEKTRLEAQEVLAGKRKEMLSGDLREQRRTIIPIIESIEENNLPLSSDLNMLSVKRLFSLAESMEPGMKREVYARLHLQECYAQLSLIKGKIEDVQGDLKKVATKLGAEGRALTPEDFDKFFNIGLQDLTVAKAFMELQKAAIEGIYCQVIPGRPLEKKNYLGTSQSGRIEDAIMLALENKLMQDLLRRGSVGAEEARKKAKKSIQLAVRLATVTFETSVWDREGRNAFLSKIIYLYDERTKSSQKGEDPGPVSTIEWIDGFGTSFLRQANLAAKDANRQTVPLVKPAFGAESFVEVRDPVEREEKVTLLKERGLLGNRRSDVSVVGLRYDELARDSYLNYLSSVLPRYLTVYRLLTKSTWEPKDISRDTVEDWIAPFKTADPGDKHRLRSYFVTGILIQGLEEGGLALGWNGSNYALVRKNLIEGIPSRDENNNPKTVSFIDKETMKWIESQVHPRKNLFGVSLDRWSGGITRTGK